MHKQSSKKVFSNVIGFDDAPFSKNYQGKVKVVGTVFARLRLTGVLVGEVDKDGDDAAEQLGRLVSQSKFAQNVQLIMLQGITLGGFNVVDVAYLHAQLGIPVVVVARRAPDLEAIRAALLKSVPNGVRNGSATANGSAAAKWALIEKLGPMQPVGQVYVQFMGLTRDQVAETLLRFTVEGHIPEPLRTAHLIAGAIVDGESRGRA